MMLMVMMIMSARYRQEKGTRENSQWTDPSHVIHRTSSGRKTRQNQTSSLVPCSRLAVRIYTIGCGGRYARVLRLYGHNTSRARDNGAGSGGAATRS